MSDYGLISLVPPILTVVLAIWTRNIIISLVLGILSGSLILTTYNPLAAVIDLIENRIFVEVGTASNIQVLVALMCIGGFIRILEVSGGANAFAKGMTQIISTKSRAQYSTWLAGLAIFFTDNGNALIIGPLFRPVFKELRICREKLAYILDCTASPICILIPFIGWGAYIMGIIENAYADSNLVEPPLTVLLNVLPFQFYAILTLAAVPFFIWSNRDFGPMRTAQIEYEKNTPKTATKDLTEQTVIDNKDYSLSLFIFPITTLLGLIASFLTWYAMHDELTSTHIRSTLMIAYVTAAFVSAILLKQQQNVKLTESLTTFIKGTETMVFVIMILVFAWSLSSVISDLGTAKTLSSMMGDSIPPALFPAIVFILGAIISLATGSSWGTFAILLALAVPVANNIGAPMYITVAAVLSGGLFGDHTSPISDTTVLASIAADCPHVNHVNTQFYYAIITGGVTLVCFIFAGFYPTPWLIVPATIALFLLIQVITRYFGEPSEQPPTRLESLTPS